MSSSMIIVPVLLGGLMAYLSWRMPLKRHVQLLGLCLLATGLSLLTIVVIRVPGDTFLDSLFNPPRWKLLLAACTFGAVAASLAVRLVTRQQD